MHFNSALQSLIQTQQYHYLSLTMILVTLYVVGTVGIKGLTRRSGDGSWNSPYVPQQGPWPESLVKPFVYLCAVKQLLIHSLTDYCNVKH